MTIYEPVTDIGKAIAKMLTKDDGIRLDVHAVLEKWEPEYIADMEKAEKWDNMLINNFEPTYTELMEKANKLDELIELLKQHDNPDDIDQWILEVRETWEAWYK